MNQQEMAARLNVIEAAVQNAMRKVPPQLRHEILTGLAFQFGQEPGERLIVEQWTTILDPQDPNRGHKLNDIEEQLKQQF